MDFIQPLKQTKKKVILCYILYTVLPAFAQICQQKYNLRARADMQWCFHSKWIRILIKSTRRTND